MTEVLTRSAPSEISGLGLDRPVTPMINSARIARRVRQLGRQISEVYADIDTPLVMVVILKGATVFAADLLRSLSIPAELEFVRASSYPTGTSSNGACGSPTWSKVRSSVATWFWSRTSSTRASR